MNFELFLGLGGHLSWLGDTRREVGAGWVGGFLILLIIYLKDRCVGVHKIPLPKSKARDGFAAS